MYCTVVCGLSTPSGSGKTLENKKFIQSIYKKKVCQKDLVAKRYQLFLM